MTDTPPAATRRSRRSAATPPRRRISVLGVIGEIFITVGVLAFLYVGWQLWVGDWIQGQQNNAAGQAIAEEWAQNYESSTPSPSASESSTPAAEAPPVSSAEPIVLPDAASGEVFGIMHIPRFGPDYAVQIAGGVGRSESLDLGAIGHYSSTQMPGAVGNFAVAAHRGSHGAPFMNLPDLHVGDAIVIQTQDGWYTYRYRSMEYVTPDSVDVLLPVPREQGIEANGRYLTMTTCSPRYGFSERLVAYAVFESFTPGADGAPASLSEAVT
ncbi:class E sortase [Microbacterium sp. BG28]|uniref:class E sortase n=1 Tax=Microbacterium sp. BG28 TaxID=3097356 RepID=UPI002A5B010C|nr:class E sortase [Microbacterium sp. BG28]MDY0828398.1 class E sortase [Microbacterium sp. BG28]